METRANYSTEQDIMKQNVTIPGGIAGEVHENAIQEKVGKKKFHPFLEEKVSPLILNIYKDYSITGYFVMIAVSFVAIALVVGALMGIYMAVTN